MKKKIGICIFLLLSPVILIIGILFAVASSSSGRASNSSTVPGSSQAIVEVALSQVGNVGGEPYWRWYGFDSHVNWCASFVSWCADQCGYIESGIIPKFSYCPTGEAWFKQHGQWKGKDNIPKAGDIVFYDWNNDSVVDHVGIVQYSKDDKIVTVEGNTSDINHEENVCAVKTRTKEHVYGYGVPAYPFNSNVEGSNLEEQVYNYLCKAGFSKASTCGIMGNMYQESGVNPSNIQGGGKGPAAGICQWENYTKRTGRWKRLEDMAKGRGVSWTDIKVQLDFLIFELQGGDPTTKALMDRNYGGLSFFMNTTDVEWATKVFETCFERAGKPNMPRRIKKAKEYYERF